MKILFASLLLFITAETEWMTNFETAKVRATEEHKYILLNFSGSDWCAPCIKLKQEVFESENFKMLADEKLVLVRADFPRAKKNQLAAELKKHNEALAEEYNTEGKFPLTLLLDSNGKLIKKWDGYVFASQDKFIAELNKATVAK
jgi:thioredoxin-related protein